MISANVISTNGEPCNLPLDRRQKYDRIQKHPTIPPVLVELLQQQQP
ncbi:hypothetical protein [Alkalinema sp. FACHB-956]|nr:hypothetical protein [Alkalinema sp. FACHB-956]MBD2327317.1 hypothetical protein [Alkalinema sp. FACHB-956]